ncbi:autotransporter outer membrane beta-barrel domain-containing protein [Bordetella bronchiseptica]|uniref:autotransporter outer membrane beta-barrel domain-containing protein n=1 Tax=Bordetella bronchiseptica TaxID=518 RepID=UPI003F74A516
MYLDRLRQCPSALQIPRSAWRLHALAAALALAGLTRLAPAAAQAPQPPLAGAPHARDAGQESGFDHRDRSNIVVFDSGVGINIDDDPDEFGDTAPPTLKEVHISVAHASPANTPAIGVRVSGAGSALTLADSSIDAAEGGIPAVVRRGGTLELAGVTVEGGEGMGPMTVSDAGSRLNVRGGVLSGEAPGASLVRAAQGGQASIADATLRTILGPALIADGGSISVAGGSIDMDTGPGFPPPPPPRPGAPLAAHPPLDRVAAVHAGQDGKVALRDVALQVRGPQATGVYAYMPGSEIALQGGAVSVRGEDGAGVVAGAGLLEALPPGGTVRLDGTTVSTDGANTDAVLVRGDAARAEVANAVLRTAKSLAAGVSAQHGGRVTLRQTRIETAGAGAEGISVLGFEPEAGSSPATVDMQGGGIVTTGNRAAGIAVTHGSARLAGVAVRAEGSGSSAAQLANGTLVVSAGSLVSAQAGAISVTDAPLKLMPDALARSKVSVRLTDGATAQGGNGVFIQQRSTIPVAVALESGALARGDIVADGNNAVDAGISLTVASGGAWHGATKVLESATLREGGTWVVRADSQVQNMSMRGGRVELQAPAPGASYKTLTLQTLDGSGVFVLNANIAARQNDQLRITGRADGQHRVLVRNAGGEADSQGARLGLVHTQGQGNATFRLANAGEAVDLGTWRYDLVEDPQTRVWSLQRAGQALSGAANAAMNAADLSSIALAESNALDKRLGELRLRADAGGPWARTFSERQQISNRHARAYDQTVSGLEIGLDRGWSAPGGRWYAGGLLGYTYADRTYPGDGGGKVKGVHVGGYAAYVGDSGYYLDTVLRLGRYDQQYNIAATDGGRVTADYRARGAAWSLEGGRRFELPNDWFAEPQAEVMLWRTSGKRYRASNGLRVKVDANTATLGRVGLRFGRRIALAGGNIVQPYARLGWTQEFDSTGDVRTNGIGHAGAGRHGRAELGAGVDAALGKGHNLYASYEYAAGDRINIPWSLHAGYRYSF